MFICQPKRQDGMALGRGRRREEGGGVVLPLSTVYRLLNYFTELIFRYKKGNAGASIPPLTQLGEESPFFSIYYTYSVFWILLSVFHN